jgi:hypothetical protein
MTTETIVLTSPYDFLLSNPLEGNPCSIMEKELAPKWEHAFEQCQNYRAYLEAHASEFPRENITSYVLVKKDLDRLFDQNNKMIDRIRLYIGHQHIPVDDGTGNTYNAVRLFVVGCVWNSDERRYDDFGVPEPDKLDEGGVLGETRPCPDECGSSNGMNSDVTTP